MKGLGEEQHPGWTLQTFEVFMPKGLSAILDTIKDILLKGKVQTLMMEVGRPIIYTQMMEASEAAVPKDLPAGMTLGDVSRNVHMEEYVGELPRLTAEVLQKMFLIISLRGLYVTHIGIGPETRFFRWLGVDEMIYGGLTQVFGAELVRDKQLGSDIMILFAGPVQGGQPEAVTFALKHHLFLAEDLLQEEVSGTGPEGQAVEGGNHTGGARKANGTVAAAAGGQQQQDRVVRPRKGRLPQG